MQRFALAAPLPRSRARLVPVAALAGDGFAAGRAWTGQPYLHADSKDLVAAKGSLEAAQSEEGGHRVKALDLVNGAIAEVQVQAGIEFDRSH